MAGYYESAEPESFEISSDLAGEQDLPLSEADEIELAAQLLEITSEEELDQFLGNVFRKIGKGLKKVAKPLGGILKKVAKVALPIAGKVAGTFFGGPVGGMIGGKLASVAGKAFGLETEGLSPEDRDFEIARRYVRLAAASARNASRMRGRPSLIARRAVLRAARTHAPGIIRRRRRPGAVRPIRRRPYPRRPVAFPVVPYPAMDVVTAAPVEDMPPDTEPPDTEPMDAAPDDTADAGAAEPQDQASDDDTQAEFLARPFRSYGRWVKRGRQVIIVNC